MKVGGGGGGRKETSFLPHHLPALLLAPFFARSLTLVPRSFLLNRTETLATEAICFIVFFFFFFTMEEEPLDRRSDPEETQPPCAITNRKHKIFQVKPLITLVKISLKRPPFVNDRFFLTTCERPLDVWSDLCFTTTPLVECKELLVANQPSSQGPLLLGLRP